MKKSKLIYVIYLVFILSITTFLSIQMLKWKITGMSVAHITVDEKGLIEELEKYAFVHEEGRPQVSKDPRNSDGFRDYEHSIEKPNNTFRIIALGDSMTIGEFVKMNNSWPKQLERKINNLNLTLNFEVFNFGIEGIGTLEEVKMFEEKGLKYEPDMVILEFVGNDWEDSEWIRNRQRELWESYKNGTFKLPEEVEKRAKEIGATEEDISRVIGYIALSEFWNKAERIGKSRVWKENVERPLLHLIDLCKKRDITLMVIAWDFDGSFEPSQEELLSNILKKHHIPFLNLSPQLPFSPEIRLPDSHLSEKGYDIVSNKTLEFLLNNYNFQYSDK